MNNDLPKGQSAEVSTKRNQPGVYRHKETGAEIICYPGKRSVAQADAFVRLGYVRVGDQPSLVDLRAKEDEQLAKDRSRLAQPKVEGESDEEVAELRKQLKAERAARTRAENKLVKEDEQTTEQKPEVEIKEKEGK